MAMFFDSWTSLGRTALVGVLAYGFLLLFLRLSGKRTLSKMNAFDLVVTVALGSTLATVLTSRNVPLADGVLALALLIALQFGVATLAVRSRAFRSSIKSEPRLLVHDAKLLGAALREERVTPDEVRAAMRSAGVLDPRDVAAVVLETDGSFSVLRKREPSPTQTTLDGVAGATGSRR